MGGDGKLFLPRLDDEAIAGFSEACSKSIDDKLQKSPAGSGPLFWNHLAGANNSVHMFRWFARRLATSTMKNLHFFGRLPSQCDLFPGMAILHLLGQRFPLKFGTWAIMVAEFPKCKLRCDGIFRPEKGEEVGRKSAAWGCVRCFFRGSSSREASENRTLTSSATKKLCNVAEGGNHRKSELSRVRLPEMVGLSAHWTDVVCVCAAQCNPFLGKASFQPGIQHLTLSEGLEPVLQTKNPKP